MDAALLNMLNNINESIEKELKMTPTDFIQQMTSTKGINHTRAVLNSVMVKTLVLAEENDQQKERIAKVFGTLMAALLLEQHLEQSAIIADADTLAQLTLDQVIQDKSDE